MLVGNTDQEFVLTGTVLLPLAALQAVDVMVLPRCPAGERDRLANFIRVAHPLGMQIVALQRERSTPLAAPIETLLGRHLAGLHAKCDCFLEALARCFRERTTSVAFPDLRGELDTVDTLVAEVRDNGIGASSDYASISQMLALVNRYRTLAERLQDCRGKIIAMCLDRYLRDVAL